MKTYTITLTTDNENNAGAGTSDNDVGVGGYYPLNNPLRPTIPLSSASTISLPRSILRSLWSGSR
jgi:hypothetical protein